MEDLRRGIYDVLVGVNLLREGLDLPEVALVAILDADKEGFLRSARSLTQTAGRAARNVNGRVIMYAKEITQSMQQTIDETERRRAKQLAYNEAHHIVPRQIVKALDTNELVARKRKGDVERQITPDGYSAGVYGDVSRNAKMGMVAEEETIYNAVQSCECKQERIERLKKEMKEAASKFDFILAAQLRDEIIQLEK